MPLKECNRWNVDEDVLADLGVETLAPHLQLNSVGWMLDHFDNHHLAQTANKTNDALDDVDDQATQHVLPGLCVVESSLAIKFKDHFLILQHKRLIVVPVSEYSKLTTI